jgi:hypothetical protein
MNLSNAVLESGVNFHRFHEELNRVMKINVIALSLFHRQLASGLSKKEVKEKVYDTGELWGGMPSWKDPYQLLKSAQYDLGNNGVVRVFSALDVFMDTIEGELGSWNDFLEKKSKSSLQRDIQKAINAEIKADVDKFFKLMTRRGWNLANDEYIKSVYSFYRYSRDCIAHRNGIVSTALSNLSKSQQLKDALDNWKKITTDKTIPPIKPLMFGDSIKFTHRDAIFASSITRSMAMNINDLVVKEIGKDGIVYLTAQKFIFKECLPVDYLKSENVSKAITSILYNYRRITEVNQHNVKECLIKLGIHEDCKRIFKKLKATVS